MNIFLSDNTSNSHYVEALKKIGVVPVTNPLSFNLCSGLILIGGGDISPEYYNEQLNGSEKIDAERDKKEFKFLDDATKRQIPILGICRGHQLLNVYFGGTLFQEIFSSYHRDPERKKYVNHEVITTKNSFFNEIYGEKFIVNSWHHQAINKLAPCFDILLKSPDGIIEGVMHKKSPVIGVQWHPEKCSAENGTCDGLKLMKYFADICYDSQR